MSHRILYVSAPTPVLILTTAQPTRSVPDISTNLGAYINGTDTGYSGTRVLVIFILQILATQLLLLQNVCSTELGKF